MIFFELKFFSISLHNVLYFTPYNGFYYYKIKNNHDVIKYSKFLLISIKKFRYKEVYCNIIM